MLSGVVVVFSAVTLFSAVGVRGQDVVSDCPIADGYFADSVQCDKYYECVDNVLTQKLCPDGMSFNDINHRVEKCDFNYQVDCKSRPELQPAQSTDTCPRQNGYFPHSEPGRCEEFYYCSEGKGNHLTCPESLVFSLITGTCVWPDEAGRTDNCKSSNVVNFTCPTVPPFEAVAHPRYADPDDCQYFYVCINGKIPRRNGCKFGQVFNTKVGACGLPKQVPECADYYFDYFTEYFATLNPTEVPSPTILQAAVSSGFKVPAVAKRVRVRPSGTASLTGADGVRRRRPVVESASRPEPLAPFDGPQSVDISALRADKAQAAREAAAPPRPTRRRTPSLTNRQSSRTTTRAPTTTLAPANYDYAPEGDYVYYDDYPDGAPADAKPAAAPAADAPTPSRFSLNRPSRT